MKLEEFLTEPNEAYIKAERYLNNGSKSGIKNTTSVETSPLSSTKEFELVAIEFDDILEIGVDENFFLPEKLLLLHPDLLDSELLKSTQHQRHDLKISVSPTASGRTTYCRKQNIFIKLAYLELLGRIPRHIGLEVIQSAAEVSRILQSIIDNKICNPAFSILKEDKGRIAKIVSPNNEEYELGVIFREGSPYPNSPDFLCMIPFFSLFSNEYLPDSDWELREVQDEPLIVQLFHKQNEYAYIADFTLNKIIKPLYHTYFDALIFGGIELEAHAQNMLVSINSNLEVIQIVCRDLESAGRDISLMKLNGINFNDVAKSYKYIQRSEPKKGERYSTYQRTHSFMFDFKLGEYIISPLIDCISKFDSTIDKSILINEIKEFNRKFIEKLPKDYFPMQWCDYNDVVWDNNLEKIYNWYDDPKYR